MKHKLVYQFIFTVIFCANILAQNIFFERLNLEKGEIQSVVYSICYDKYGNAWFATEEGLARYNSKDVYLYNTNKGVPAILGNRIYSVYNDRLNHLWIGSETGIGVYNPKKDVFDEASIGKVKIFQTNQIIEDQNNQLWLVANNGIWRGKTNVENPRFTHYLHGLRIYSICYDDDIVFLATNRGVFSLNSLEKDISLNRLKLVNPVKNASILKFINNQLIIGTNSGELIVYSPFLKQFKNINFSPKQTGLTIRDIEYKDQMYYLAIDGEGLFLLDNQFSFLKQFSNDVDYPNSISSNGLYDIYFGRDGVDWYATYAGGVNYSIPSKQQFKTLKHEINIENSISNNITRTILEVGNTIWFGTKKGISIYNTKTKNWEHITSFPNSGNKSEVEILSLARDKNYIWAGSYYHGLFRISTDSKKIESFSNLYPNQKLEPNKIFKVFIDNSGNIWVGGIDSNLSMIMKGKIVKFPISNVKDITQDFSGNIFTAGNGGVYEINPNKLQFKKIKNLDSSKEGILYNNINVIITESSKIILGTNGAGIIFYDKITHHFEKFNSKKGLPSDIVQGIISYGNNNYWISTTKGLCQLNLRDTKNKLKIYTKSDGLSSTEYNYGAYTKLFNGDLLFGGIDGVTWFNPYQLKDRKVFSNIYFEELYIDNEPVSSGDILANRLNETEKISLNYNQNSIAIKFVGILQGFSNKVKYTYKLDGFDKDWSIPGTRATANYTNLNPGEYTFRVRATDELGNFGSEKNIVINISRPWYASILAMFIYVILLGFAINALIKVVKILEVKKNKEEQVQFFNNITHEIKTPLAILLSTIENTENDKNTRIKSSIERINSLINQMLNFQRFSTVENAQLQVSKINLNNFIKSMINDFKPLLENKKLLVQFENNYREDYFYFDEEFLNKILFNLLSNAIKYSFENNKILLIFDPSENNQLSIKIKDYGIGIPKEAQKNILSKFFRAKNAMNNQFSGTGLGLMIVNNIVELAKGKISFESEENYGTTFKVILPSYENQYSETNIIENATSEVDIPKDLDKFCDKKILLVEDNDDLREHLLKNLENYFLVYEAKNGKEGLEMSQNIYPDLIITDYMMPEMDGYQMAEKILENINLNHIPIFMLTALQNTKHKTESTNLGITEYIEKPVSISFLVSKIANVFSWQLKLRDRYQLLDNAETAEKHKNQKENEFLERLEKIVLEKIQDENFSLHDLCNAIGMSRTSLYMKLKNLIDLSPQDFIIHTKLKHAKKLLIEGELNIKEVAYASGFSNPKYFSTSFKKIFGASPSDFIKKIR